MNIGTFILVLSGFFFSALFSGMETGSYTINRFRLRHRVERRRRRALALSRLLKDAHIFIFTVLIGNNIAVFLVSKAVTGIYLAGGLSTEKLLYGFIPWNAEIAATLTLVFPLFILAELGPKNLFRKNADLLMYRLATPMRLLVLLFYPLTWLLKRIFLLLTRGLEKDPEHDLHRLSPDALREYFSTGEKEGIITPYQNRMLDNVSTMHRLPVRRLMTPLQKVPRLSEEATVADLKKVLARKGTVYAILMHRHRAVGMVTLFSAVNRRLNDNDPVRSCAEDVLQIEENRNLKSAFYRLRRNPRHSAVVVNAHKHPVGFVRLEDIARYITMQRGGSVL